MLKYKVPYDNTDREIDNKYNIGQTVYYNNHTGIIQAIWVKYNTLYYKVKFENYIDIIEESLL